MKKRVLSLGIVLTMMASSMQTFAEDYSDMPTGWSNAAMTYAVNNGYIKGSNGKLNPQGLATRAQVASIFARVLKLEDKADLSSYTDVNASQWYYDDLAKAVDAGLFKGSDNKLRPNDNITREEVMAIIARAYDLTGENANLSAFIDGSTVSSWAVNAVSALVENGIVNGSNGKLNPKTNITREEFAQLLYNCQNKFGADEESTEITTDAEDTSVDTTEESSTETTTFVGKNSIKAAGGGSSSSSSKKSNTKTTEATTETTTEETTETTTAVALESQNKVTVDGVDYYVATLEKPMSDYTFTFNGTAVTPTAVNAEKTIVKYSDNALSGYKFAKKTLTYGEYWYAETSDGFNGTLSTEFAKNGAVAEIPDSYTATQSADDKYAANGADTDAGMYDAVSRATTGYGLGRLSFTQAVDALNSAGKMAPFSSSIKYENGDYTVVRPDNAKTDFGYDGSSNRGSNGKITATGIKDVVVAVSKDMAVNAEILKNISGYEAQAQKVSDEIASLNFDADLNENNVYAYKELNANGLYGKRVVNDNVSVKNVGNYSEANTNDDNKFTVNTKYAKRFGDVTFLVYFDDYANMKADDPAHKNINTDEAVAGKVGEFKDYIYNVQGAKIEYLGEDGTATPVVAGAKFASDLWISPNHGPVVEVAVTNSYDRFKAFGNGKYRITLVADGYKDVVLESSARFDLDSPLKMQGDDDDVNEITNGTDLVLNYDINNATYAESLVNAVANGTANITIGEGRNTVAENGKVIVNGNVLTLTFENVKDSLVKDTQYTVTFPTLDYNDADKLGMTASVHYAPADAVSTTAEENNEEKAVVTETEDNTTVFEDVVKDSTSDITDVIAVALPEVDETKAVVVDETTVAETEETTEEVTEETTEEATAETIVEEVTESETVAE
ncbi:MAG: S-layer homology domain-containing protein [Clostridia bacterium]|nr:S-layer homology domain-containing protein [Clostridia bacterium]